jgi:AraC-like DNA-binding protein
MQSPYSNHGSGLRTSGAVTERCSASKNARIKLQPTAALRDRIISIERVDNAGGYLTVLPTTGAVLGVQVRGHVRAEERLLAQAGVTGIQGKARQYAYAEQTSSLLVRFTPQGAACLGVPVSELADRNVALSDLLPRTHVSEVQERLCEAKSFEESVNALQTFFLALPFVRDSKLDRAFALLGSELPEQSSVAAVARTLELSERQLERRMLARTGMTPKRYARLRRFERAAALLSKSVPLAQVAHEAGYYDQSHFIREFQNLVGTSPGKFVQRGR